MSSFKIASLSAAVLLVAGAIAVFGCGLGLSDSEKAAAWAKVEASIQTCADEVQSGSGSGLVSSLNSEFNNNDYTAMCPTFFQFVEGLNVDNRRTFGKCMFEGVRAMMPTGMPMPSGMPTGMPTGMPPMMTGAMNVTAICEHFHTMRRHCSPGGSASNA